MQLTATEGPNNVWLMQSWRQNHGCVRSLLRPGVSDGCKVNWQYIWLRGNWLFIQTVYSGVRKLLTLAERIVGGRWNTWNIGSVEDSEPEVGSPITRVEVAEIVKHCMGSTPGLDEIWPELLKALDKVL